MLHATARSVPAAVFYPPVARLSGNESFIPNHRIDNYFAVSQNVTCHKSPQSEMSHIRQYYNTYYTNTWALWPEKRTQTEIGKEGK